MENKLNITENKMTVTFDGISENEALARVIVAAFATRLDPTLEEISDIKTAVSEAVTNAIVHGYQYESGDVNMNLYTRGKDLYIEISDNGCGIEDISKAKEPLYTTKPEQDRCGMGFVFMEVFMDEVEVISQVDAGTTVKMKKCIGKEA
ncbi:MAG: anti-sigma F factor [Lachnospiraceae bacterium]|nr:anti-sigma F factor [Lachnospiraceae bacterium]MDE6699301.1 anti-sigma F factor [Lachnospiraceae bacterium]